MRLSLAQFSGPEPSNRTPFLADFINATSGFKVFGTHSIRDKPIAPGSPWQNCFAERLIGSIRRECVDHVVALGEQHLREVVKSYASYYNTVRAHRSWARMRHSRVQLS